MKPIRKILLFVNVHSDVPQAAVETALELAQRHGASLDVCDCVDSMPTTRAAHAVVEQAFAAFVREKAQRLEEIRTRAEDAGIGCETDVLRGDPGVQLVKCVIGGGHDIVLKTMMPEPKRIGSVFGGTARTLMRKCPTPVWLVAPRHEVAKNVVVAYPPVGDEPGAEELSTDLFSWANAVAHPDVESVTLAHAFEIHGEQILSKHMPREEYLKFADETIQATRASVEARILRLPKDRLRPKVKLLEGRPEQVIPAFAKSSGADVLVVGTVARTGLRGILLGNTAEEITNHPPCSLLIVKPADFMSPVMA
jgi:nucleotide-binding universal stress UspA family protein